MRNIVVTVETIKEPIQASDGFAKKLLSEFKLDIVAKCGFGCSYCSSESGTNRRIKKVEHEAAIVAQVGRAVTPLEMRSVTLAWSEVLANLERQVLRKRPGWGRGKTLVFSMLTDAFSPFPLMNGTTRRALEIVLAHTEFRIRILTKNSIVGSGDWIEFFQRFPGRFVVGLSTGTLDDGLAAELELGTSTPAARIRAIRSLQDAGVPTYGMFCPVFPSTLEGVRLESLVEQFRPELVEHVWAEPYNERINWRQVRDSLSPDRFENGWLTEVYENRAREGWSRFAADLYLRLKAHADQNDWAHKLRYLLYEEELTAEDAARLGNMEGILLQTKPGEDGFSQNPAVAEIERRLDSPRRVGGEGEIS